MKIGLQYFGLPDDTSSVKDVLDYTVLAERSGLDFVCFPERHYGGPGGISPDPLLLAGIALGETESIEVRTGSLLLPLHEVSFVAERIAILRARFGSRFGVVVGSGWNRRDFLSRTDVYDTRREHLWPGINNLRILLNGGSYLITGTDEIKLAKLSSSKAESSWCAVACSVNSSTVSKAAELGLGIHTHMERIGFDSLSERINLYKSSFRLSESMLRGFGVTVMLHSMVVMQGNDFHTQAIEAMEQYLSKTLELEIVSADLGGDLSAGAKTSPLLLRRRKEELARYGALRVVNETGLIGTPSDVCKRLERYMLTGASEIAALVDFDPDSERVRETIAHLGKIRKVFI